MVVERVNFILRIVLEALLEESKVAADEWKSMREIYKRVEREWVIAILSRKLFASSFAR